MTKKSDATKVVVEGKQYHIKCAKGDLPRYVLMPGDPKRVEKIGKLWDKSKVVAEYRQYYSRRGKYKGTDISCLSSGIGCPGLAVALEEAIRVGVDTFIRVGTCGSISKDVGLGDIVISSGGVRLDGTSRDYAMIEYPAVSDYEVTLALILAAQELKVRYHVGITATTDSFYCGQGRPGYKGYMPTKNKTLMHDLQIAKVLNFEMETSCLFTMANIYGMRAGSCCVVIVDRVKDKFELSDEFEKRAALVASEAVRILSLWDKKKKKQGLKHLSLDILSSIK